jgi:hypothetical protein
LSVIGTVSVGNVPTAQAADSFVNLTPAAMTYTDTSAATTVYSGASDMVVSKSRYASYLKFDTSKIAATSTIVSAELTVNVTTSQATQPALWVAPVNASMDFSKMSYSSRPALLSGGVNPNETAVASANRTVTTKLSGLASSKPASSIGLRLGYTTGGAAVHLSKTTRPVLRLAVRPATSVPETPTAPAGWASSQSSVPLGGAGCNADNRSTATAVALAKEWDYWDNCGGTEVSAAAEGLPAAPGGGDHVFRWYKAAGDSNVYQKLNRTFTKDNWATGSAGPGVPNSGSPADASGIYKVAQYIPSARFRLNPGHAWVILSEFKENYTDSAGNWHQDPTWQLGCNNMSGATTCSLSPHNSPTFALSSYMDRWVTWEYRIYQGAKDTTGHGGRIELWADGKLLDTGYESQRHVGSAAFGSLSQTKAWVWIAGQYTSNQTTNGVPDYQNTQVTSYLGRSSVTPIK